MKSIIRVRFAPSPTGLMHLGNVRSALFNYLFTLQKNGTFILRVEDTDLERNFDPGGKQIMQDLAWLNLSYNEGPGKEGQYGPYLQSQRTHFYQENLALLQEKNLIYRCFCTSEELEKKRKRQIALKLPPRYDRICLTLSHEQIEHNLAAGIPFIWRFKLDTTKRVQLHDLARGTVDFDLQHFTDFPLTRQNGSFTFLFANAVDDILMKITHVFRGEDHVANTPYQLALYEAFNAEPPFFWHMPIICNNEGKKLSKRDFGFSLQDLKAAGFLPEAICNYLAIIGASFAQEIMTFTELAQAINFEHLHSLSAIRYDVEKLRWVNHQWIMRTSIDKLIDLVVPLIQIIYPQVQQLEHKKIATMISMIQPEAATLQEFVSHLQFYFEAPLITKKQLLDFVDNTTMLDTLLQLLAKNITLLEQPEQFVSTVKQACRQAAIDFKLCFKIIRFILTGTTSGLSIKEIIALLGPQESKKRLEKVLH